MEQPLFKDNVNEFDAYLAAPWAIIFIASFMSPSSVKRIGVSFPDV